MMQYYKQTQLETMASEKAAAEFQLEKEMNRLQEVQVCQRVLHSTPIEVVIYILHLHFIFYDPNPCFS